MMATDARDEVEALGSVETATIRLHEHMHEMRITEGVNKRQSFGEHSPTRKAGSPRSVQRSIRKRDSLGSTRLLPH